jgi:hypothetical protein
MTPGGIHELPATATQTWLEPVPAGRVERAMDLLRVHLVERTARNEWDDDDHVHERAIVICLRQSADVPMKRSKGRAFREVCIATHTLRIGPPVER